MLHLDWHMSLDNPYLLYVMRGVMGSGKSTTARTLAPVENIFSADHFFGSTPEEYKLNWHPDKLGSAHGQCKKNVRIAMQNRLTPICVDNTNVQARDVAPYLDMAIQYGYRVELREPTSPWWLEKVAPYLTDKQKHAKELDEAADILFGKCIHGVPLSTIRNCLERWHTLSVKDMLNAIVRRANEEGTRSPDECP